MKKLILNMNYIQFDGTNLEEIIQEVNKLSFPFQIQRTEDKIGNIISVNIQFKKQEKQKTKNSIHFKPNDYIVVDDNYNFTTYKEEAFKDKFYKNTEIKNYKQNNKYCYLKGNKEDIYYYIQTTGEVNCLQEDMSDIDSMMYNNINYFIDEKMAKNFAKIQLLQRKLLIFSLKNGMADIEWGDCDQQNWFIKFDSV